MVVVVSVTPVVHNCVHSLSSGIQYSSEVGKANIRHNEAKIQDNFLRPFLST